MYVDSQPPGKAALTSNGEDGGFAETSSCRSSRSASAPIGHRRSIPLNIHLHERRLDLSRVQCEYEDFRRLVLKEGAAGG